MRSVWSLDTYGEVTNAEDIGEFVLKVIENTDPRRKTEDVLEAKNVEIVGIKKRDTWTVANPEEVATSANILGSRFGLTLKYFGTSNEKAKARLVAQGYCDQNK